MRYEKPTPMYGDEQLDRMAFDVPVSPGVWADRYIQLNAVKGIRGEYEDELTKMRNTVAMRESRIAELEAAASELVELRYVANGERLAAEQQCVQLQARIAALEAEVVGLRQSLQIADIVERANGVGERWEPVADDDYVAADIEIALDGCVIDVDVMDTDGEPVCYRVVLPDDIRLCRKAVTDEATD